MRARAVLDTLLDKDCIFCKIVAGEIPSARIHETKHAFAFLDIAPVNPGHALVIAKGHHPTIWDVPGEQAEDLLAAVQAVGRALMAVTGAAGMNLMQNNHRAAGQLVDHVHFHLIPRHEDDGLQLWPQQPYDDKQEMERLARAMAREIESRG